jgi:hypothetical protein
LVAPSEVKRKYKQTMATKLTERMLKATDEELFAKDKQQYNAYVQSEAKKQKKKRKLVREGDDVVVPNNVLLENHVKQIPHD